VEVTSVSNCSNLLKGYQHPLTRKNPLESTMLTWRDIIKLRVGHGGGVNGTAGFQNWRVVTVTLR
jgi:hypothetical protein